MNNQQRYTEDEINRKLAKDTNQKAWKLLEQGDLNQYQKEELLSNAHVSLYYWKKIGKPENVARGQWLISRVYCVLNIPELAILYAHSTYNTCTENYIEDFDLAYAYEALARAYSVEGNCEKVVLYKKQAIEASQRIKSEQDKTLFMKDFNSEPW